MGKNLKQWQTSFSWALKSLQTVTAALKLKDACSLEEKLMTDLGSVFFADKGLYSQSYGFSSSHVQCEKLDYKEGWALKN